MKFTWICIVVYFVNSSQSSKHIIPEVVIDNFSFCEISRCYIVTLSSKKRNIEYTSALHNENIKTALVSSKKLYSNTHIHSRYILKHLNQKSLNIWKMGVLYNLSSVYVVVIQGSLHSLDKLVQTFEKNNFAISSKIVISKTGHKDDLIKWYNNGTNYILCNVGIWPPKHFYLRNSSYNEQRKLTGITIKAFTHYKPGKWFDFIVEPQEIIEKFHYNLFLLLQELHDFSYVLTPISRENNVDDEVTHKNDIIVSGMLATPLNVDQFDFLIPLFKFKTCFFFRQRKKSTISFLKPLSLTTWKITWLLSLVITILLTIALKLSKAEETSWTFSAMTVFSTLCQDGDDPSPDTRDIGCKIIFFSLLIMSLLLFNYYTSSMVSLLLSEEVDTKHTIEELVTSDFVVGVDNNSYTLDWITHANVTDVRNLYQKKLVKSTNKTLNIYSIEEGIDNVRKGRFAFHTDIFTAYGIIGRHFDQNEVCDLKQAQMIPPVMAGLVVNKSSELSELFRISLLKLNEEGLIHKLLNSWKVVKPGCYANTEVIPLGMAESLPTVIFLIAGIVISFLVLGLEVICFRSRQ